MLQRENGPKGLRLWLAWNFAPPSKVARLTLSLDPPIDIVGAGTGGQLMTVAEDRRLIGRLLHVLLHHPSMRRRGTDERHRTGIASLEVAVSWRLCRSALVRDLPGATGCQLPAMSLARAQRLYRGPAVPANGLKELFSRRARQCGRPRVSQ
jgi:hypothetical protein